jgi:hypothetical protein
VGRWAEVAKLLSVPSYREKANGPPRLGISKDLKAKPFPFRPRKAESAQAVAATISSRVPKWFPNEIVSTCFAFSQPMIPAHDCHGLHVFAGTWQSPADL